jgi:MOSC domain-containing protein YiiM
LLKKQVDEVGTTKGRIKAISVSKQKGTPKTNVPEADLKTDFGIVGDAHAGNGHRQVSLLAVESLDKLAIRLAGKLREKGVKTSPGDFAENIMTEGLDVRALKVGSKLRLGGRAELEITQLGKRCHRRCSIFSRLGDCVMPRDGVFARVTGPGRIKVGDVIEVVDD